MQRYLYHRVPKNMLGDTLYPLNELKNTQPDLYTEAVRKYVGREKLLQDRVPFLDCLWNDVVHLSPVHPVEIAKAYEELGHEFNSQWYQIDANSLDASKAVIYWYKYLDFRDKHQTGNYEPFSLGKLTDMTELPQITKDYYRTMFEKREQPLLFVGVPHILYRGALSISGASIVGRGSATKGHERLYRRHINLWGKEPSVIVTEAVPFLDKGPVLDLGAGDGRNTLYFGRQGFDVTAVDIAPTGIKNLLSSAEDEGCRDQVKGIVANLGSFLPEGQFSTVISTFTLHFLSQPDFDRAFKVMLDATSQGGINIVEDFTQDGPLYETTSQTYWFRPGELRERYIAAGWEIIAHHDRLAKTRAIGNDGRPLEHNAEAVIARKPRD